MATDNIPAKDTGNPEQNPAKDTPPELNAEPAKKPVSESNKPEHFKAYTTKEDFDGHAAVLKGKGEKEILALLGLKPDEKDKINAFKKAYEDSLTDAEKTQKALEKWQEDEKILREELVQKDHIIAALVKLSGKTLKDVDKLVKMAASLVNDDVTFEQAFNEVIGMLDKGKEKKLNGIPKGEPLDIPDAKGGGEKNPFIKDKDGKRNMDAMSKLILANPKQAAEYAAQAGFPVTWRVPA